MPLPQRAAEPDLFDRLLACLSGALPTTGSHAGLTLCSAFQPVYSLSHGRVVGHEALLRASDPQGSAVPPPQVFATNGDFEELLTRDRLARMVHLANYFQTAPEAQWLFLNVHPDVFVHGMGGHADGFVQRMGAHFRLQPHRIVIEVTEEAVRNDANLESAVENARASGCMIAIDDFGAGHSNFDRVWRWQPEIVKLDRSLVARAAVEPSARRIVVQMVSLLHECGALVLMEGVERPEEADVALEADADLVQGYLFGRPNPQLADPLATPPELDLAWQRFDDRWRHDKRLYRERMTPYLEAMTEAQQLLAAGRSFEEASRGFLALPWADVCYLLGADGRQVGSNQWADGSDGPRARVLLPLQDTDGGRWSRRPYFRRAIDSMGKVQVTRPYRTLHGGDLCVTLSAGFRADGGLGAAHVICGDVRWNE